MFPGSVHRDLTKLQADLRAVISEAKFFQGAEANFDAGLVYEQSNRLRLTLIDATKLFQRLERRSEVLGKELKRSGRKNQKPLIGDITFRGSTDHLVARQLGLECKKTLASLERARGEVDSLHSLAERRMDEPGRWGDGAPDTAVAELVRLGNDLVSLVARLWRNSGV